jgi:predicted HD superfamily hydrolase involved in NAD metabolism
LRSFYESKFMNFDVDHYIGFAEEHLTPQRFKHSLGVMQVMGELAAIYNLDATNALTAGILHDIAKEFTSEALLKFAGENKIPLRTEYDRFPLFLHGPVGAGYVALQLGVADPVTLDAISRHSYFDGGAALSPPFCWCLRFADILEPTRDWKEFKSQLKPFVYSVKIREAAYLLMNWLIPFHESMSLPVHPKMRRLLQELSVLRNEKDSSEFYELPV